MFPFHYRPTREECWAAFNEQMSTVLADLLRSGWTVTPEMIEEAWKAVHEAPALGERDGPRRRPRRDDGHHQ